MRRTTRTLCLTAALAIAALVLARSFASDLRAQTTLEWQALGYTVPIVDSDLPMAPVEAPARYTVRPPPESPSSQSFPVRCRNSVVFDVYANHLLAVTTALPLELDVRGAPWERWTWDGTGRP